MQDMGHVRGRVAPYVAPPHVVKRHAAVPPAALNPLAHTGEPVAVASLLAPALSVGPPLTYIATDAETGAVIPLDP